MVASFIRRYTDTEHVFEDEGLEFPVAAEFCPKYLWHWSVN